MTPKAGLYQFIPLESPALGSSPFVQWKNTDMIPVLVGLTCKETPRKIVAWGMKIHIHNLSVPIVFLRRDNVCWFRTRPGAEADLHPRAEHPRMGRKTVASHNLLLGKTNPSRDFICLGEASCCKFIGFLTCCATCQSGNRCTAFRLSELASNWHPAGNRRRTWNMEQGDLIIAQEYSETSACTKK